MDEPKTRNRLLLVDGDPSNLRVLDVTLRSAGFDVETATTGTEAWALLEDVVPDLIIADTNLKGHRRLRALSAVATESSRRDHSAHLLV